jgi:hypothetical protein
MKKYHVTINANLEKVTSEEVYAIEAESEDEAKELVLEGNGSMVGSNLIHFGHCTDEEVLSVFEIDDEYWGGYDD